MMNEIMKLLQEALAEAPVLRADSLPTIEEIDKASHELGVPFVADYREFLLTFGGAMVGPYPIFGLRPVEVMGTDHWSVVDVTIQYRNDGVPGTEEWIVFSEDHAGNPVGIDADGKVWIHDHDFGGITLLSLTFEGYLRARCLAMER